MLPIVGRRASDELRHRRKTYRMNQHGFARDSRFAWTERGERRCVLLLEDSEATRALYPFAFRLTVTYTLDAERPRRGAEDRQRRRGDCRCRSVAIRLSIGRFKPEYRKRAMR
ncbi:hypothetical protein L6654_42500 [Bradyrhizobium sp. WYCCWR 13023]|uniref:Uncharacterized protein n=1 Tax=Bradyrhizobium zhengyangense TaxID=2911009 RepID=A0A9X1RL82_9BRAD|nr:MULTISPECIES: hypothetical protein [Bradyrhizobium]MCG2633188.1 hypothetical protein [Bradyrhizobium zhengyangense]MCG2673425.1 hypothetical protein [Bradyrhizobium zhengyangense]